MVNRTDWVGIRRVGPLGLWCCLAWFTFPALGADPPAPAADSKSAVWTKKLSDQFNGGNRWAVVVGIGGYKKIPVPCCVSGAKTLAAALQKHCGYTPSRMLLLTDDQHDKSLHPTLANIRDRIAEQLKEAEPGDTMLVFFTGHGMGLEGKSYLCPLDYDGARAEQTSWRTDDLRKLLHSCKASQKLLILDCCHSGGAQGEGVSSSGEEVGAAFQQAQGLLTLASCRKSETALATQESGVFTHLLARGLQGLADSDGNGIVDSDEIYRYLLLELPIYADEVSEGHKQTPVRIIGEDVVGIFAISRPNGPLPPPDNRPIRPKPGDILENSIGMKLVCIPPGTLIMGSSENEHRRQSDEAAQQTVNIAKVMFMGTREVTQEEYLTVMGKNPSYYSPNGKGSDEVEGLKTRRFPVEQVSWNDAVDFCRKLSRLPEEVEGGRAYRLPTEAEWEYACRAGTLTTFHTGDLLGPADANIRGDRPYLDSPEGPALGRPAPVGSYKPNAFGLYDMHGNVAEWCSDWYTERPFASLGFLDKKMLERLQGDTEAGRRAFLKGLEGPANPEGPSSGETRVIRGGSFTGDVAFCRSAARRHFAEDFRYRTNGFRVVCTFHKRDSQK